jgi:hypothetical protein
MGVIVLFIATGIEWSCFQRLRGATTSQELRLWTGLTRGLDKVFASSTVVVAASGLYLAWSHWGWGIAWINLALVVLVVMSVVGPAVNTRRLDALARASETAAPGPVPDPLARQIHDPVLAISIHTLAALGFGVVVLKVVKPDLEGALGTLVVAVVLGVIAARPRWVRRAASLEETAPSYQDAPLPR